MAPIYDEEEPLYQADEPMLAGQIVAMPEEEDRARGQARIARLRLQQGSGSQLGGNGNDGSSRWPSCTVTGAWLLLLVVALVGGCIIWTNGGDGQEGTPDRQMLVKTAKDQFGTILGFGTDTSTTTFTDTSTMEPTTTKTITTTTVATSKATSTTSKSRRAKTTTSAAKRSSTATTQTETTTVSCAAAVEGDYCYGEVVGAMYSIREKPNDYAGLTMWSSFEEVQNYLVDNEPATSCKASCECETAQVGSECFKSVSFAKKVGIKDHPEWYEGLSDDSPFEAFQAHLWEWTENTTCEQPCQAPWRADTSLFCWSVARNSGYEADVMKLQVEAGAGIFSCDGFAVVSEADWTVGHGPGKRIGKVKTVTFTGAAVGISKDGTAANTELFINAWKAVIDKTLVLDYDWTLKVDPDAVILVDRLRDHLAGEPDQQVFIRNCNKVPENPDFPMMFGSLEAISRAGLQNYADNGHRCKDELDWYSWGEDFFLGKCLPYLGVQPRDDFSIISDGVCTTVDCYDGQAAAFHPFKTAGDWMQCWNAATYGQGGAPPPLP